jgi:hypothetical protein
MYIPSIAILGLYIAGFIYSRITEEHGDDWSTSSLWT